MRKFSINDITKVIDCNVLFWDENKQIEYFAEYPEEPLNKCLYFLFDNNADENDLLGELSKEGASGVIVKAPSNLDIIKWRNAGIGIIEVKHLTESYLKLAKLYRNQFKIPFVQVIGSSGKTTTKEMIGAVLNSSLIPLIGWNNYNAPSGVAYNIFNLRSYHNSAVLEVGMKAPGIMSISSEIIKPHIVVLTAIHRAHFVSLGSIEKIINAKAEVLDYIDPKGTLIINGEDANCRNFPVNKFKGKICTFGFSEKFDIWASDIRYKDFKTYFKANINDREIPCTINTIGKYNVANALASILVGLELGLEDEDIQAGLANFEPLSGRLKIIQGIKDTMLINDNFNANPDSTKMLIKELPYITNNSPLIIVLGDMERPDDSITEYARKVHYQIGEELAKIKFDNLLAIGKWAKEYVKGAKDNGANESKMAYFRTVEEAEEYFKSIIIPKSIIIFKASEYVPVRHLIKSLGIMY